MIFLCNLKSSIFPSLPPISHSPQSLLRRFHSYYPFIYLCLFSRLEARQALLFTSLCLLGILFSRASVQLQLYVIARHHLLDFPIYFPSKLMMKPRGFYLIINKGILFSISRKAPRFSNQVILSLRYTLVLFQTSLIYESNSIFSKMWDVICVLLQRVFPSGNTQSQWGQILYKNKKSKESI